MHDIDTENESGPWYRNIGIGRVALIVFMLSSALFWIWALGPLAPRGNADRLDDRAFPEAAEKICERYQEQISFLPLAHLVESVDERAVDVEAGTEISAAMIAELKTLPVPNGEDGVVIALWFEDWAGYMEDRYTYIGRLEVQAEGDDLRFLYRAIDDIPIDARIGNFARVNDMDSCEVPGDV
jgi:hypothetical protein